jgi:2-(1,2-epoxy-1,2-dihydrophenyl)acetyl-CoA isomerase
MSQSTDTPGIRILREGDITTLILDNPRRKNAINTTMARAFLQAIQQVTEDDSRVVILTGAGADFCAGADLDPGTLQGGFDVTHFLRTHYNPAVLAMRASDKPFIAQVRGSCVGVGFNFALACDLILASETATFSQIFTRIGLSSDGGGAYFMPERLGYHKAYELMVNNTTLPAAEALRLGLVNHVLADDQLDEAVQRQAMALAQGPYIAIQRTKANIRTGITGTLADALDQEAVSQGTSMATHDFMEGVMAFIQKRKPVYKGK